MGVAPFPEEEDMKPESFPLLRISKQYGLDYGDVLTVADSIITGIPLCLRHEDIRKRTETWSHDAVKDITDAVINFLNIRVGKIDWITGKPMW